MKPRLKPLQYPFDWTPLVDISFLLLIFMLVSTTSTYPQAIHLNPIAVSSAETATLSSYAITVDRNHVILAGPEQKPVALLELEGLLLNERARRVDKDSKLDLRATLSIDRGVDAEMLLSVLGVLQAQGIPVQVLVSAMNNINN